MSDEKTSTEQPGLTNLMGIRIACFRCGDSILLPYTDETKTAVSIAPIDGWTAPPTRCPGCSAAAMAVTATKQPAVLPAAALPSRRIIGTKDELLDFMRKNPEMELELCRGVLHSWWWMREKKSSKVVNVHGSAAKALCKTQFVEMTLETFGETRYRLAPAARENQ